MFVPQAGKTAFNQSTFILIIRVSFAVWCPRFETEETKNKHAAPGKENTHKFTPLCLSVLVGPTFSPLQKPAAHSHTHTNISGMGRKYCNYLHMFLQDLQKATWNENKCAQKNVFTLVNLVKYMLIIHALFSLCTAMWGVAAAWLCVDTVQASLRPSHSAVLSVLLQL